MKLSQAWFWYIPNRSLTNRGFVAAVAIHRLLRRVQVPSGASQIFGGPQGQSVDGVRHANAAVDGAVVDVMITWASPSTTVRRRSRLRYSLCLVPGDAVQVVAQGGALKSAGGWYIAHLNQFRHGIAIRLLGSWWVSSVRQVKHETLLIRVSI
jgi:hypothetical protein